MIEIDLKNERSVIEKRTDGTIPATFKGKTIFNGVGGNTTYQKVALTNSVLCEKGRQWACDGEYFQAVTTGAGQSSHYLGDVAGTANVTNISTKTTTHKETKFDFFHAFNWYITDVRTQVLR